MVKPAFWKGRKVFLTGHTGFKGSWLALWLKSLGAEVSGYALPAPTKPSLFEIADVTAGMHSTIGDIRDADQLARTMHAACPEIIFHLAAQPLVGDGYKDPVGTYTTNVIGTVNLLEIARTLPGLRCIVVITTDKCYANHETRQAFRESDPLGGRDPYSSSKACAELVCEAYRQSFLPILESALPPHGLATSSAAVTGQPIGWFLISCVIFLLGVAQNYAIL